MQGKGIAAALIGRGLELLDSLGVPAVFLEGDPGYYLRLAGTPGYVLAEAARSEIEMCCRRRARASPR